MEKKISLGGADKNDKLIFGGDETIVMVSLIILDYQEKEKVIREEQEKDVKDKPKTIDKVEKKPMKFLLICSLRKCRGWSRTR